MAQLHIIGGAGESLELPAIRKIGLDDLTDALAKGWDDFSAMPSHAIFLCLIYPLVGLFLIGLAFGYSVLPLLFPLAAGFALIGPVAAVGLYELSRRREAGLDSDWTPRLRRAALAIAAGDRRARPPADGHFPGLARQRAGDLSVAYFGYLPPQSSCPVHPGRVHHVRRLEAHRLGQLVGFCFALGRWSSASSRSRCWSTATSAPRPRSPPRCAR